MSVQGWTLILTGLSLGAYVFVAWRARATAAKGFYVAGSGVPALVNGMAAAGDWMSAASFISVAGVISLSGYSGSVYLMGWTGGFVLLVVLLVPYLSRFGGYTLPDFVGERYYSDSARLLAVACAIVICLVYVWGQMRGVGIVFSRFLEVPVGVGVLIGMVIVLGYTILGGMRGSTWTQAAQCAVLLIAYAVPAVAISAHITGQPVPQIGYGSAISTGPDAGKYLLHVLDELNRDLGFAAYTSAFGRGQMSMLDMLAVACSLMAGTAGLPHVLIRFYSVQGARSARIGAGYALLFILVLYTTIPAVGAFGRYQMIHSLNDKPYAEIPAWFQAWEKTGLVAWTDKNGDGRIQYGSGAPFYGTPRRTEGKGRHGEPLLSNEATSNQNELYINPDAMLLATPEISGLSNWTAGLLAAGALAAALCTTAGLLLVIGSAVSHDLYYRMLNPKGSERTQVAIGRVTVVAVICLAGFLGIWSQAVVAEVVAYAFGLAAASFFPVLILGIFWKRTTGRGALCGMAAGTLCTAGYIVHVGLLHGGPWFFGISAEGIGVVGMAVNFAVTWVVSLLTAPPPKSVEEMVEGIRYPRSFGEREGLF